MFPLQEEPTSQDGQRSFSRTAAGPRSISNQNFNHISTVEGRASGQSSTTILCDISTGRPRPWVPASLCHHIFNLIHNLSHPSHRAPTRLITQKFVWLGISRDVGNWVRYCIPCQKYTDTPRLAQDLSTNHRDILPTST
ncbi:hypothetical protein Pcinc_004847 [Petrolisthes cinctipes]|uniref:Integrase zinc-binding domain-containing protein n=1 Tax=Petrolisthes cinctipes TaxID=88211 RepID=A0AAE1KZX2_PETCI|nr:hypothetical protein Pcinc_004847 [Petrolisthes cinctipes]